MKTIEKFGWGTFLGLVVSGFLLNAFPVNERGLYGFHKITRYYKGLNFIPTIGLVLAGIGLMHLEKLNAGQTVLVVSRLGKPDSEDNIGRGFNPLINGFVTPPEGGFAMILDWGTFPYRDDVVEVDIQEKTIPNIMEGDIFNISGENGLSAGPNVWNVEFDLVAKVVDAYKAVYVHTGEEDLFNKVIPDGIRSSLRILIESFSESQLKQAKGTEQNLLDTPNLQPLLASIEDKYGVRILKGFLMDFDLSEEIEAAREAPYIAALKAEEQKIEIDRLSQVILSSTLEYYGVPDVCFDEDKNVLPQYEDPLNPGKVDLTKVKFKELGFPAGFVSSVSFMAPLFAKALDSGDFIFAGRMFDNLFSSFGMTPVPMKNPD